MLLNLSRPHLARPRDVAVFLFGVPLSLWVLAAAYAGRFGLSPTEAWGFVTGGWCVYLTVKENIWNFPIGIANSAFFAALFWNSKLFADMGLQFVYIALGFIGWGFWLFGGAGKDDLPIARASLQLLLALLFVVALATAGMTMYLQSVHDAAPLWDALTTTLSLAAQFLLTKKFLENWWFWIAADLIYVPLYLYKHLYLTAGLYALFLALCVAGILGWRKTLTLQRS